MLVFDGDISEHKIGSEQLADVSLFPWPSADSFLAVQGLNIFLNLCSTVAAGEAGQAEAVYPQAQAATLSVSDITWSLW